MDAYVLEHNPLEDEALKNSRSVRTLAATSLRMLGASGDDVRWSSARGYDRNPGKKITYGNSVDRVQTINPVLRKCSFREGINRAVLIRTEAILTCI